MSIHKKKGLSTEEALQLIMSGKLLASTEGNIESEYISAGTIILQNPVAGSYMEMNGTVMLTVSSGSGVTDVVDGIATVPYVVWDTVENAREKLIASGLGEPTIVEVNDDNVAAGQVISQSVEAGELVDEGTVIELTVSIGPASFSMPSVVGKDKATAEETLRNLGIVVVVEYEYNKDVPEDSVIRQSIEENQDVKRGDEVTIVVSSGEETITVEDVVGKKKDEAEQILKKQGFDVVILENYDQNVAAGIVISQAPPAGTSQKSGASITIYVSRGKNAITVKLDANGGSVDKESISVTVSDKYGSLPTPTRKGYSFDGWYSKASGGEKVEANTVVSTPSSHTLYAHWTPNKYTVSFDANGGAVSPPSVSVTYDSTYGDLPIPTRAGYAFDGWYTEKSGGSRVDSGTKVAITGGQTLYAHWTAGAVTVTFDANGGNVGTNSKAVSVEGTYGDLPTPTRTGYTFDGWYTANSGGSKVTSSTKVSAVSNHTLYAHWTVNKYTLTFEANGGSVSPSSRSVEYGAAYGELPVPTRTGYSFDGWYTDKNAGIKVTASTVMGADNATVYAHWKANSYTLTFDANGGAVSPQIRFVVYGTAYGELPVPTRTGYSFDGWYTDRTGGSKVTAASTMGAGNVTVYAHWNINSYTLTFDSNGGDAVSPATRQVKFEAAYGDLPSPRRDYYTFDGWYTDRTGGSKVTSATK